VVALRDSLGIEVPVVSYDEHAIGTGADASAVAFVEVRDGAGGTLFGVGRHTNIVKAALKAVACAANRLIERRTQA
jgi:2-isopropylmalate synthase